MNWIQCLSKAVQYIEERLTDEINIDEISSRSYTSSSHFQLIFHLVMGMTVGEYIRNRRLSLAAQDLLQPDSKIIDVAMRYQYDTQESFSKAFTRFHGVPPSKVQRGQNKLFHPLTINVIIQGGFEMSRKFIDEILFVDWNEIDGQKNEKPTNTETYNRIVGWARRAIGQNQGVFDALAEWILDDSQWSDEKLAENELILMQGVLTRIKEQNAKLRAYLKELEPSGVVNAEIFKVLDRYDDALSGKPYILLQYDERLNETVAKVFADFSAMRKRGVREIITGYNAGSIRINMGYIWCLKNCDAGIQWALFMPESVRHGLESRKWNREKFEYIELGKTRFIGQTVEHDDVDEVFDSLEPYAADINIEYSYCYLTHFNGQEWQLGGPSIFGRFYKEGTPVPDGYDFYDVPTEHAAFAVYSSDDFCGDIHNPDDAYVFTRDQILADGVSIPYPQAYWQSVVYTDGFPVKGKYRFGYLFSVER